MRVRAISWNVNCRRGDAVSAQAEALLGRDPDLVALQEVTRDSVDSWRAALEQTRLAYIRESVGRLYEYPTGNLIASRWPLRELPPLVTPRPERFLSAVVETEQGPIEIHNAHIPDGSSNELGKVQGFVDLYASLAAHKVKMPRLLCGDFNSPKTEGVDGSVAFFGSDKYRGLWEAAEGSVLLGLGRWGLTDVFRRLHGYGQEAASWIHRGTGRRGRYDHMLASRSLRVKECAYHQDWLADRLSDHAPIEATFDWSERTNHIDEPFEIRAHLESQANELLTSRKGREHRILELADDQVLIGAEAQSGGITVRVEWIEAAARRLQVNGQLEVTPSTLGTPFAAIGAVLRSLPGVRWRDRMPARLFLKHGTSH